MWYSMRREVNNYLRQRRITLKGDKDSMEYLLSKISYLFEFHLGLLAYIKLATNLSIPLSRRKDDKKLMLYQV